MIKKMLVNCNCLLYIAVVVDFARPYILELAARLTVPGDNSEGRKYRS